MTQHPIQPLVTDQHGVLRFKENKIVRHLLDNGGISLNAIAVMDFTQEDREQFAQLIGYSHSGASDLGYMSDEVLEAAERVHCDGENELQARCAVQSRMLDHLRQGLREPIAELFGINPEDLGEE